MKVVNSYIFRAVCALLVGILLVSNPERMTGLLVQVIGGLFLISGLVTLVNYFIIRRSGKKQAKAKAVPPATGSDKERNKPVARTSGADKRRAKPVFPLVGVGSLLFGVFLGFFPELFITYLMYIFGFLMVVAGINQLWNMFSLRRLIPFRWYFLFFTVLIMGVGMFVLFNPLESASLPFIFLGAGFMLYGMSELVNGVRWRKYGRMQKASEPEDAEWVEVRG